MNKKVRSSGGYKLKGNERCSYGNDNEESRWVVEFFAGTGPL